jgi:hypothetical protein
MILLRFNDGSVMGHAGSDRRIRHDLECESVSAFHGALPAGKA